MKRRISVLLFLLFLCNAGYAAEIMGKVKNLNISDAILILNNGMEFNLSPDLHSSFYEEQNAGLAEFLQDRYVIVSWKRDKQADTGRVATKIRPVQEKK